MSSTITWTIHTEKSGQPRAYADHQQVGTITLGGDWHGRDPDFSREVVKRALKGISIGFAAEKGEKREWHEAYLDYLNKVAPGRWEFRIVQPYLD